MARKQTSPKTSGNKPTSISPNARAISSWAERIRQEIKRQKKSQRSVSMAAGLGHSSLRYLLTNAETISLSTAQQLADALGLSVKELLVGEQQIIEADDDVGRIRVKVIGVRPRNDMDGEAEAFVAVHAAGLPDKLHAFKMTDTSMVNHGLNEAAPPDSVILQNDIIVWSPGASVHPGSLIVVNEGLRGQTMLTVRRLVRGESGKYQAVANSADYGRADIDEESILGGVIQIQRLHID